MLSTLPGVTDILVIGARPAGISTAVSPVARGRAATIVDQQPEGADTSRESVIYSRTLEVLDPYGVAEQLPRVQAHVQNQHGSSQQLASIFVQDPGYSAIRGTD